MRSCQPHAQPPNRPTAHPYPQGLIYSPKRNALIICDTENHAVRLADLGERRTVVTLAGNGSKGRDYRGGRAGSAQPLNSPWDVALDEKEVGTMNVIMHIPVVQGPYMQMGSCYRKWR